MEGEHNSCPAHNSTEGSHKVVLREGEPGAARVAQDGWWLEEGQDMPVQHRSGTLHRGGSQRAIQGPPIHPGRQVLRSRVRFGRRGPRGRLRTIQPRQGRRDIHRHPYHRPSRQHRHRCGCLLRFLRGFPLRLLHPREHLVEEEEIRLGFLNLTCFPLIPFYSAHTERTHYERRTLFNGNLLVTEEEDIEVSCLEPCVWWSFMYKWKSSLLCGLVLLSSMLQCIMLIVREINLWPFHINYTSWNPLLS